MKTDEIASKFLGKRVSGSENYDPSSLFQGKKTGNNIICKTTNFHFVVGIFGTLMNFQQ